MVITALIAPEKLAGESLGDLTSYLKFFCINTHLIIG